MKLLVVLFSLFSGHAYAQKIVSMSPTITEIVAHLGQENQLVGVSSFCSYPKSACQKTRVGTALTPDMEKIVSLQPDYILSQHMQNSSLDRKAVALGLKVLNLKFDSLTDIEHSIIKIGELLKSDQGQNVSDELRLKSDKLKTLKKEGDFLAIVDVYQKMGRVTGVLVAGNGTFYSDLLELTGLKNAAKKSTGGEYLKLNLENLLELNINYFFFFSPKENNNKNLLKKELQKFSKKKILYYSYAHDYAVIPGPRLGLLIEEMMETLK